MNDPDNTPIDPHYHRYQGLNKRLRYLSRQRAEAREQEPNPVSEPETPPIEVVELDVTPVEKKAEREYRKRKL